MDHPFLLPPDSLADGRRHAFWRELAARDVGVVPTLVVLRKSVLRPPEYFSALLDDTTGAVHPLRPYLSAFLILDWREQAQEHWFAAIRWTTYAAPCGSKPWSFTGDGYPLLSLRGCARVLSPSLFRSADRCSSRPRVSRNIPATSVFVCTTCDAWSSVAVIYVDGAGHAFATGM